MAEIAPGFELVNSPHGFIDFGPQEEGDTSNLTIGCAGGYYFNTHENGNTIQTTPGKHEDICGYKLDPELDGNIAKNIIARNGDIHIIAENGDLHLKARNIFIDANGAYDSKKDVEHGVVNISGNASITIGSPGKVTIAGVNICLRGQSGIDLVSYGFFSMLGEIKESQPLSPLSFLNPAQAMESLIQELLNTCK